MSLQIYWQLINARTVAIAAALWANNMIKINPRMKFDRDIWTEYENRHDM